MNHENYPYPNDDQSYTEFIDRLASGAVDTLEDNAKDMGMDDVETVEHLEGQLDGYVELELESVFEGSLFFPLEGDSMAGYGRTAAYHALHRDTLNAAVYEARRRGYTMTDE